jgi:FKBP12-rapamycin complex-associated protein
VRIQVIDYCTLPMESPIADGRRELIRNMWNERIKGTKRNVEVWQALLAVRELVLPPNEDRDTWIKFAKLCWKSGRISQAKSTLIKLLQVKIVVNGSMLISVCLFNSAVLLMTHAVRS